MKLLVDKDFESSSLWVPGSGEGWASCDHHTFGLPEELVARLDYLSDWFETYNPGSHDPEPDWAAYGAYLLALAVDLKRHFGDAAQVFVRSDGAVIEVTGEYTHMARARPLTGD